MLARKHLQNITTVAALLAIPVALSAQDPDAEGWDDEGDQIAETATVDLEARAGVGMSAADLGEYTQPGLAVGAGAGFWLTDHFALRVDGDFSALGGDESGETTAATTPDMNIYHFGGGLEVDLLGRDAVETPWTLEVNAGAGSSMVDTEDFLENTDEGENADVTETVANVNAGAEIGRELSEDVLVSLSAQAFYMFLDEDNFNNLAELRPAAGSIQDGVNVPVTLSLRWDIPNPGTMGN